MATPPRQPHLHLLSKANIWQKKNVNYDLALWVNIEIADGVEDEFLVFPALNYLT